MELFVLLALFFLIAPAWALIAALSAKSRLNDLEREVREVRALLTERTESERTPPPLPVLEQPEEPPSTPAQSAPDRFGPVVPDALKAEPSPAAVPVPFAPSPVSPARRAGLDPWRALVAFFSGPSAFARLGAVVLLVGVGLGLKYAADLGWLSLTLRLWGVVVAGAGLLLVGWRLRRARPAYAVALMGTAFGLWYLTAFSAWRFYALLPSFAAFALLALLGLGLAALAAFTRAQVLALLGALGGFLAPVLTSGGAGETGGPTLLFGYYALLNPLVLPLGARFGWRGLATLGFLATFGVGTAWGVLSYQPQDFGATEPFLVLFFLMYALLPLAEARLNPARLSPARSARPHGAALGLAFALPVVFLSLQASLLSGARPGMALTCLALSALYALLARLNAAWRAAHLALAVATFTLSVPFALGANLTPAALALEGAALALYALRARAPGWGAWSFAVQGLAALSVVWNALIGPGPSPLEGWGLAALLAAAALPSARFLRDLTPFLARALGAWGALVWLLGGAYALLNAPGGLRGLALLVAYVGGSSLAFALLGARWRLAAPGAARFVPLPFAALTLPAWLDASPFAALGWLGFAVAVAAQLAALEWPLLAWRGPVRTAYHALTLWFVTLLLAWALAQTLGERLGEPWALLAWGALPALAVALVLSVGRRLPWVRRDFGGFVRAGALPLLGFALAWFWGANFSDFSDFSVRPADPLPTLPLLNPLDLTLAGVWLVARRVLTRSGARHTPGLADALGPLWARFPARAAAWFLGASGFAWASLAALRGVAGLSDLPWRAEALLGSGAAQSALTLTWTALGMGAMLWATRQARRAVTPGTRDVWLVGAGLLGVVTVKLFLVDFAGTSALARVVTFISVGALLLLIGYLSPAPPRDEARGGAEADPRAFSEENM